MSIAVNCSVRADLDRFEDRTKGFAVSACRLTGRLWEECPHLRDQLRQFSRAATSVCANQRAMRRSRSLKEFAAKLQIVNEEIDEAASWLGILEELLPGVAPITELADEARQLRAMFAKARSTTRLRLETEQATRKRDH